MDRCVLYSMWLLSVCTHEVTENGESRFVFYVVIICAYNKVMENGQVWIVFYVVIIRVYTQVTENGQIILSNAKINHPWNETFKHPARPLGESVLNGTDSTIRGMIACFWADSTNKTKFHKVCAS